MRIPFGITSAPTVDVFYQWFELSCRISWWYNSSTTENYPNFLHRVLQKLKESGLQCRLKICVFVQPTVEDLRNLFFSEGIIKIDALNDMTSSVNVKTLSHT